MYRPLRFSIRHRPAGREVIHDAKIQVAAEEYRLETIVEHTNRLNVVLGVLANLVALTIIFWALFPAGDPALLLRGLMLALVLAFASWLALVLSGRYYSPTLVTLRFTLVSIAFMILAASMFPPYHGESAWINPGIYFCAAIVMMFVLLHESSVHSLYTRVYAIMASLQPINPPHYELELSRLDEWAQRDELIRQYLDRLDRPVLYGDYVAAHAHMNGH